MAFSGWPEVALDFYEGLAADNSRTYWTRHKQVYDEMVLGPMADLADELAAEFGPARIFRPYRDVRFSKDKTPYKTNIGAMIGSGYVQLSAEGLAAGHGMYMMTPDQLDRYRQAVAGEAAGHELADIIAALARQQITVNARDLLKTAPRGYPADHPRIGLLKYKGIYAWQAWPVAEWLGTPAAAGRVAGFLRATRPLSGWLAANVGPGTR
jgi:uncharacterized protein (TIGR02453 family)